VSVNGKPHHQQPKRDTVFVLIEASGSFVLCRLRNGTNYRIQLKVKLKNNLYIYKQDANRKGWVSGVYAGIAVPFGCTSTS